MEWISKPEKNNRPLPRVLRHSVAALQTKMTTPIFILAVVALLFVSLLYFHSITTEVYPVPSNNSADLYVSGDFFRAISDVVINSTESAQRFAKITDVEPFSIIFLKTDYLRFLSQFQSRNKVPYVLITHQSDGSAPGQYYDRLNDPNLVHWFAENTDRQHEHLTTVPIGIANLMVDNLPRHNANQTVLQEMSKTATNVSLRKLNVYLNFSNGTNPDTRAGLWSQVCSRKELSATCVTTKISWRDYLSDILNSKFVLSPPGNGIDCYRTWESLALGSIPIVLNTTISSLYKDEKVLVVNSFEEITPQLLEETLEKFSKQKTSAGKLYRTYWIKEIYLVIEQYVRKILK